MLPHEPFERQRDTFATGANRPRPCALSDFFDAISPEARQALVWVLVSGAECPAAVEFVTAARYGEQTPTKYFGGIALLDELKRRAHLIPRPQYAEIVRVLQTHEEARGILGGIVADHAMLREFYAEIQGEGARR